MQYTHTREDLEVQAFSSLTCCGVGGCMNNGSCQIVCISERSFLYQPSEHNGNASYWQREVACVLQAPGLKRLYTPSNYLEKRLEQESSVSWLSWFCHEPQQQIECLPKGPVCLSLWNTPSACFTAGQSSGSEAGRWNRSGRWYVCKYVYQVVWPIARGRVLTLQV